MTSGGKGKKNACSTAAPPAPAPATSAAETRPRTSTGARWAGPRRGGLQGLPPAGERLTSAQLSGAPSPHARLPVA